MATKRQGKERYSAPVTNRANLTAIIDAISKLDQSELEKRGAWSGLEELSSGTYFEGMEPHPDGIFQTGKNRFEAIATVYVTLNYGGKSDHTAMSDSYPARVMGRILGHHNIEIESIEVDTRSFYQ